MELHPLSFRASLDEYKKQAKALLDLYRSGDPRALYLVRQQHPRLPGRRHTNDRNKVTEADIRRIGVSLADAQTIIAGFYAFESWPKLAKHVEAVRRDGSPVWQFESAVEAIITGDVSTLQSLLRENPDLIRARSTREHHATLLHYVGANGVEGFRQRTPPNAVQVADLLLRAGAEVDADLDYRGVMRKRHPERFGSTTLGMVATSFHPAQAGVQLALLDRLLKAGASVNGLAGKWNPLVAALHNGRGDAAAFLARRGARLDLEGAAGAGRLDAVKRFFKKDGSLKPPATREQMEAGFEWACEYGRTGVVAFLLRQGVNVSASPHGETGLHWAAYGGHLQIVKMLLKRGAPLEVRDRRFNATPLGWALEGWCYPPPEARRARYHEVVALLVAAGAVVDMKRIPRKKLRGDARMQAALHVTRRATSAEEPKGGEGDRQPL